ncbi:von Willebrand factor A domain-containing protein 1-like, partial [Cynoglossus semilaevis]|uniref:von Willebrand factor A domain-containing protein 1-like n=1 Tax=Cynoglossus semilaevis TaxID=244447 RepID=UPI000D6284B8
IQLKANGTFVHYLFPGLNRNILVLLDSSGSLSDYEFSQLLRFTSKLLRPLTLDNGNVRVGLLQVGTSPHLEFGLDVHKSQRSLQEALQTVRHLRGNTNTVEALRLAQRLLSEAEEEEPKILLWLTDGAQPGDVTEAMTELKTRGVTVMIVATVHANYHLLQQAVTPPLEANLYTVDMDDIDIITEELRKTIISMCVSLS